MQGLILTTTHVIMSAAIPACLIVVQLTQTLYLRASKQLRWSELESRSLVGTSFLDAVRASNTRFDRPMLIDI
jgi:hypothetical protein